MSQAHDTGPPLEAWQDFYRLTKWSTIGVAVVLILLVLFLL
ncbi:MAG: aa3-type cytochrome c oxidase subunit IV [Alphaproteobacteria bacterium]|nr:aa3-type cytochrome c oxidase subunit IV [Alphaproteobacteria bacterium]